MNHLVIMAAGTGGHVMPGLAVAREMQSRGWSVSWLGTTHGMENQLVPPQAQSGIALDRVFAGLMTQGVGIWMGAQSFINMGVNLGVLPTKGLTLPLMSFGGSAILMNLIALAMVVRVDIENRALMRGGRS